MTIRSAFVVAAAWCVPCVPSAAAQVRLHVRDTSVLQYDRIEFAIEVDAQYEHPYDPGEVDLNIVVQSPSGGEMRIPAFWMQPHERQEVQLAQTPLRLTVPEWQRDIACKMVKTAAPTLLPLVRP